MVFTTDELEQEFQEEVAKKAQAKARTEKRLLSETSWVPRMAALLLSVGMMCAVVVFAFPGRPQRTGDAYAGIIAQAHVVADQVQAGPKPAATTKKKQPMIDKPVVPVAEKKPTLPKPKADEDDDDAVEETDDGHDDGQADKKEAPKVTFEAPKVIQQLAEKLLGAEDAKEFFATATKTKKTYKGKDLWFWHCKTDTLDFNPDPNYHFHELQDMSSGSLAIDIGANLGDTAVLAFKENPKLKILSFEPGPSNYIFMRWNLIVNNIQELSEADFGTSKTGVLAFFGGATKDGREIELAFAPEKTKHAQMKSDSVGYGHEIPKGISDGELHESSGRWAGKWKTFKVPSFALPAWLKAHNAGPIKWFKLDCEGCEYETLTDLHEGGFLKSSKVITGEAHYRHVADMSCKGKQSEPRCEEMIKGVEKVRKLMCGKYKFSCCPKVMGCDVFQEMCTKKV